MSTRQVTIFVISEECAGFETGVEVLVLGSWDFLADSPASPQVKHLWSLSSPLTPLSILSGR